MPITTNPDLAALECEVAQATRKLESAIKDRWPIGTRVNFLFSRLQKNWSCGEVSSHHAAYVGIIGSPDRRGRTHAHRIHWSQVAWATNNIPQ